MDTTTKKQTSQKNIRIAKPQIIKGEARPQGPRDCFPLG